MIISVITPVSRGVSELSNLFRDFKNQIFKDFERICVFDGPIPEDVQKLVNEYKKLYNLKFTNIKKDMGNMQISPGTRPRNHGLSIASGNFVCFFDDDDRARDTYLASLIDSMQENMLSVVQMSCQESRMVRGGDPKHIVLIPEVGLKHFPVICHVGTPCVLLPRKWALEDPWRHEPEHDFRFFKRIVEKHNPLIMVKHGMQVDVDGLVTKGIKDWVSVPPFYRED